MNITELEKLSDEQLLDVIGDRANALRGEAVENPAFNLGSDDFKALGRNIFNRINRELHQLFCGSAEADKAQRSELARVFRLDQPAIQGALTLFMISTLGIDATIATVASIIIMKRILLPAGAELCAFWESHLTI